MRHFESCCGFLLIPTQNQLQDSYGPEKANYGTASFTFKKEKCAARSRSLAERLVKFVETCEWNITTSTFELGHFLF